MKTKGERPRVILDEYNSRILMALVDEDLTITRLAEKLGVAYNNLLNKLDKLESENMIIKDHSHKGRQVIIKIHPKQKEIVTSLFKSVKFEVSNLNLINLFKWASEKGTQHNKK